MNFMEVAICAGCGLLNGEHLPDCWAQKLTNGGGMRGTKHDQGKAPLSLIDRHALEEIGAVLAFGAQKYAAHNWRGGLAYSRLLDAAMRHLYAFADGEDKDPESGLSHIAHAGCCIVFLLGMINAKPEMDDRYKSPAMKEHDAREKDARLIAESNAKATNGTE